MKDKITVIKTIPKEKRIKYFIAAVVILSILLSTGFLLSIFWADITQWIADTAMYLRDSVKFMEKVPMFYYTLVIIVFPLIMLPITPLLVLAAARSPDEGIIPVLCWCWAGVILNIIISYFISIKFGSFIRKKLLKRGINVPEIPESEQYAVTFLLRIIPGNPLAVQNYLLGLADIPFFKYIVISIPMQMIQTFGYVYFGEGIFDGKARHLIGGLAFLAVLAIFARVMKKVYDRWEAKKHGVPKKPR